MKRGYTAKRRAGSPAVRCRGAKYPHLFIGGEMDQLVTLFANYIFPVAMCMVLMWKMERDQERYREDLNTIREVISQNSQILTEIKTMLGDDEK